MKRSAVQMSAVRAQGGAERAAMLCFAPLPADHPSVGQPCAVCGCRHDVGDIVTVIPLGPGADVEHQEKARDGRWYSCLGVIGHAVCAGLDPDAVAA